MTILLLLILLLKTNLSLESYLFLLSLLFITNNNNTNSNYLPSLLYYANNHPKTQNINPINNIFIENTPKTCNSQKIDMIHDFDKNYDNTISTYSKPSINNNTLILSSDTLNSSSDSFQNNTYNCTDENTMKKSDNIKENSNQDYYGDSNLLNTIKSRLNANNYRSDGSVDMQCTIDALNNYKDDTLEHENTLLDNINNSFTHNNNLLKDIDTITCGQTLTIVMSTFGIVTGEVFLNSNQLIVLRLKNNQLIHINKKYISYFYQ